ncbi:hypothetical protein [Alloscardovia criceti]|uniref:hypothetical protein n=1 Tax=Alloscardovia criceti TaxID=356828 RepID=UPI00037241E4|nr:hypothetical protein [Alloscardovia criceti]
MTTTVESRPAVETIIISEDTTITADAPHVLYKVINGAHVAVYGSHDVRAREHSTITAYGYSRIWASHSIVNAEGSNIVQAFDSTVYATGKFADNVRVTAFGHSAVHVAGTNTVTALNTTTVYAYDSSYIIADDSSTINCYKSYTKTPCVRVKNEHVTINGECARINEY